MRTQWSIRRLMIWIALVGVVVGILVEVEKYRARWKYCLSLAAFHEHAEGGFGMEANRMDEYRRRVQGWNNDLSEDDRLMAAIFGTPIEGWESAPRKENNAVIRKFRAAADQNRRVVDYHDRVAEMYVYVSARPWLPIPTPDPAPTAPSFADIYRSP
jgi:hypothetical protein